MPKFFRKIRQEFLEQGKLRKYILYAMGEIVLVVIGILIALQLNNYNASLKEAQFERVALENLRSDFEFNRTEIRRCIRETKSNRDKCLMILSQTGKRYTDTFEIDRYLPEATSTTLFQPQNGFLMDLINSGKLGVIQNGALRNRLSSWLPLLDQLKDREALSNEFDGGVVRYVFVHGSWLNADQVEDNTIIAGLQLPESGFEVNNNDMLHSLEFENMIENQIVYQSILIDRQENCARQIDRIITLIDSEIQ